MTIPNIITLFRIALVPFFGIVFKSDIDKKWTYIIILLSISALTDIFDGLIARKFNMKSKLGALLDPIADKLTQITIFLILTLENIIPRWLIILILVKDSLSLIGASYLLKSKTVISANYSGKVATVIFYISSFLFIIYRPVEKVKSVIIWIILITAFYALINYSIIFLKSIKTKENDSYVPTQKH